MDTAPSLTLGLNLGWGGRARVADIIKALKAVLIYIHTRVEESTEVRVRTLHVRQHATTRGYPHITRCSCAKALHVHMRIGLSHHMAPRRFRDRNNARVVGC